MTTFNIPNPNVERGSSTMLSVPFLLRMLSLQRPPGTDVTPLDPPR